jgi:membrane associated rhomboid family serine protease
MIPLTVDVAMQRLPWANWGLILATIVLSFAVPAEREAVAVSAPPPAGPARPGDPTLADPIRHTYSRLVLQRGNFAAYQLVTSLFQHAGLMHLLGNMLFLFVFGNAVNAKLGHAGFLASYLGIGALVNIVWLVAGAGEACLGASGAVMGLCGMFLVLYPCNMVQVFWDEFGVAALLRNWTNEVPGWAVVLLYLTFDVCGAVFDPDAGIGYVSHIVGAGIGMGLAVALLKTGWLVPDRGEQTLLQWLAGEGPVEEGGNRRPRGRRKSSGARPG